MRVVLPRGKFYFCMEYGADRKLMAFFIKLFICVSVLLSKRMLLICQCLVCYWHQIKDSFYQCKDIKEVT